MKAQNTANDHCFGSKWIEITKANPHHLVFVTDAKLFQMNLDFLSLYVAVSQVAVFLTRVILLQQKIFICLYQS